MKNINAKVSELTSVSRGPPAQSGIYSEKVKLAYLHIRMHPHAYFNGCRDIFDLLQRRVVFASLHQSRFSFKPLDFRFGFKHIHVRVGRLHDFKASSHSLLPVMSILSASVHLLLPGKAFARVATEALPIEFLSPSKTFNSSASFNS